MIYDERYRHAGYEERSSVRVLTAESTALWNAVERAIEINADQPVTLLDFGYGTGRVTNDFVFKFHERYSVGLTVVAYDVSIVGLHKAADELTAHGFSGGESLDWEKRPRTGHTVGSMRMGSGDAAITVTFVHGSESDDPATVRSRLLNVNEGRPYLLVTSWYSGLGHIFPSDLRRQFFEELGVLTLPTGELLLAVAATGDLQDAQTHSANLLADGTVGDLPIESDGDVLYKTELDQDNYWHVFSTDLARLMRGVLKHDGQETWIEAIRMPDEEFETVEAEQDNYRRVKAFNLKMVRPEAEWSREDYRRVHTVAAIRSAHPLGIPAGGYSAACFSRRAPVMMVS
ncbi:hypothetical protein [Actinoplanes sichuanensis]|uniref:SAM-dependent methyltransferase n=1 Tax=Actinoplanes sichuanensis TaxID=512349 RepID=A0ABW4A039_9ACTN|nr:hypothetical protein [Actinoplanes sichuanensis]